MTNGRGQTRISLEQKLCRLRRASGLLYRKTVAIQSQLDVIAVAKYDLGAGVLSIVGAVDDGATWHVGQRFPKSRKTVHEKGRSITLWTE
jgi:hypothetical protein